MICFSMIARQRVILERKDDLETRKQPERWSPLQANKESFYMPEIMNTAHSSRTHWLILVGEL